MNFYIHESLGKYTFLYTRYIEVKVMHVVYRNVNFNTCSQKYPLKLVYDLKLSPMSMKVPVSPYLPQDGYYQIFKKFI